MYAMQYAVGLPTDHDMGTIRDRVARTGHLMDDFPGLGSKAFLVREKERGAPRNEYAPFYVWRDVDGMRAFCWGEPGYSAIVRDFGRQPIQDWTVVGLVEGPAAASEARGLTRRTVALPDGVAPSAAMDAATSGFLAGGGPGTVCRVAAVDVTTWTVVLVELTTREVAQDAPDVAGFEVLHVSTGAVDGPGPA